MNIADIEAAIDAAMSALRAKGYAEACARISYELDDWSSSRMNGWIARCNLASPMTKNDLVPRLFGEGRKTPEGAIADLNAFVSNAPNLDLDGAMLDATLGMDLLYPSKVAA